MNCHHCGTENEEHASQCKSCLTPFQSASYVASVEKGLRRLEREKLSFLGLEPVISKFELENIERYQSRNLDDITEIEAADGHTVIDLEDAQELPSRHNTHLGMPINDIENDETVKDLELDVFDADSIQDLDIDAVILESKQEEECFEVFAKRSNTQAYPLPEREESELSSDAESNEVRGLTAQTSIDAVQDIDDIIEFAKLHPKGMDASNATLSEVRNASKTLEPSQDQSLHSKRPVIKSRLLRRDVRIPREHMRSRALGTEKPSEAIDKLKVQGVFETSSIHAEVKRNIDDIFELDKLLPQASLDTWHGEEQSDKQLKLNSSVPGLERASLRDVSEPSVAQADPARDDVSPKLRFTLHPKRFKNTDKLRSIGARTEQLKALRKNPKADVKKIVKKSKQVEQPKVKRTQTKKRSKHRFRRRLRHFLFRHNQVIWLLLIAALIIGILYLFYLMGFFAWVSPKLDPMRPNIEVIKQTQTEPRTIVFKPQAPALHVLSNAINTAAVQVSMAADFDAYLPSEIYRQALSIASSNKSKAIEKLRQVHDMYPQNREVFEALIEFLIEVKAFDEARFLLLNSPESYRYEHEVKALRYRAFAEDPIFISAVDSIDNANYDSIGPLGGGSTLTFRVIEAGQTTGAFKPLQTRRQSNYRAEIASWRLCELLDCRFSIPHNREVRIEQTLFNQLFNRSRSSLLEAYRAELGDLIWTRADGKSYLYGTLKEWVPNFARFPIEYIDLWYDWVRQETYMESFPPIEEALEPLKKRPHTRKLYGKVLEQSLDMKTADLANQIVQILMFDFLTGNWDRFSGVLDWWGVNCQFKDAKIVSIDNGAAFQSYTNSKVTERFEIAERFSKNFVENLRLLDREMALELLFPEPSQQDIRSFDRFWTQRAALLARVDGLIETYGQERVLSFP